MRLPEKQMSLASHSAQGGVAEVALTILMELYGPRAHGVFDEMERLLFDRFRGSPDIVQEALNIISHARLSIAETAKERGLTENGCHVDDA